MERAKIESTDLKSRLAEACQEINGLFENPTILPRALNAGALTYEHAFLRRTKDDPKYLRLIERLLAEYRAARNLDPALFYKYWVDSMEAIHAGTNNMAGVATLQMGKEDLEIDVLVKSYFRDVGDTLEGSLQPLLRLRLGVWERLGKRRQGAADPAAMTFGSIVEELLADPQEEEIYRPFPHSVSVSQWRNIANHNSYRIKNGAIVCTYGAKEPKKEICLSFDELLTALLQLGDVFYAHKVAYEFFGVDNAKQLVHLGPELGLSNFSCATTLAHGLASAGFSVIRAEQGVGIWRFALVDKARRAPGEVKIALQNAVWAYVLFVNPVEFFFIIRSGDVAYQLGFLSTLQSTVDPLPPHFRGSVWSVDESLELSQRTQFNGS